MRLAFSVASGLLIVVIPLAEDRLAPLQITADAMEVDDATAADLGGEDGLGLGPATHYVLGDLFQAQHLGEYRLGAE